MPEIRIYQRHFSFTVLFRLRAVMHKTALFKQVNSCIVFCKKNTCDSHSWQLKQQKEAAGKRNPPLAKNKKESWSRIGETFPDWGRGARLFEKGKAIKIRGLLLLPLFIVVGSGTRHKRPIKRRKKTKRQGHKKTLVSLALEEEEAFAKCRFFHHSILCHFLARVLPLLSFFALCGKLQ